MNTKFKKLNNSIIKCKKCSRLIKFSKKISITKRKQNITEVYFDRGDNKYHGRVKAFAETLRKNGLKF